MVTSRVWWKLPGVLALALGMSISSVRAEDAKKADIGPDEIPFEEGKTPPPPGDGYAWCLVTKSPVIGKITEQVLVRPATFFLETVPGKFEAKEESVLVEPEKKILSVVPAQFKTEKVTKVVQPEMQRVEVIPAQYDLVDEEVLDTPAYDRLATQPARYETKTETVLIAPERKEWVRVDCNATGVAVIRREAKDECFTLKTIAAQYQTVARQVLVEEAKTVKQTVPAAYKKIKVQKLVKEPEIKKITIPAITAEVDQQVVVSPESTKETVIAARYETIKKLVQVEPESTRKVDVPAVYETISKDVITTPAQLVWRKSKLPSKNIIKKYGSAPGACPEAL